MEIKEWNGSQNDLMRIIQESVPGKQITMAHIISSPDPVIYKKLGLDPRIDYKKAAIGVLTQTPSETAIITADLALKAAAIEIGFIDRFSGTLIITGTISEFPCVCRLVDASEYEYHQRSGGKRIHTDKVLSFDCLASDDSGSSNYRNQAFCPELPHPAQQLAGTLSTAWRRSFLLQTVVPDGQ